MIRWLNSLQPWGMVLLRLVLGAALLYNGWDKVVPHGGFHGNNTLSAIDRFCHYVTTLRLPYWLGYVSVFTEIVGGICLLLGLFTRFFALLVTGNLLVALILVNRHHGYSGSEYTIALIAISIMLLLCGSGAAALDRGMGLI